MEAISKVMVIFSCEKNVIEKATGIGEIKWKPEHFLRLVGEYFLRRKILNQIFVGWNGGRDYSVILKTYMLDLYGFWKSYEWDHKYVYPLQFLKLISKY